MNLYGYCSEFGVQGEDAVLLGLLHVGLLVLTHTLLEEVGLALQGDHVHPLERVLNVVVLGDTKCVKQSVSDKHDILSHQLRIHADEFHRKCIRDKLKLYLHCIVNNLDDSLVRDLVVQVLVEHACEVGVHTLVT